MRKIKFELDGNLDVLNLEAKENTDVADVREALKAKCAPELDQFATAKLKLSLVTDGNVVELDPTALHSVIPDGSTVIIHHPPYKTEVSDELNDKMNAMHLEVRQIKSLLPAVIVGHAITPSTASRDATQANALLEVLNLNLEPIEEEKKDSIKPPSGWVFSWTWESQEETASYPSVLKFLCDTCKYSAAVVGNGERLTNGLLFNKDVYTLRKQDPVTVRGQTVWRKNLVRGRTDVVVLRESLPKKSTILRHNVLFAIEIKRPQDITKSRSGCLREAEIQLIGLNVDNANSSPPVILTDLVSIHRVLYVDVKSSTLSYVIKQITCASFAAAVLTAQTLGERECVTANFSRPPSPSNSEHSEGEEED